MIGVQTTVCCVMYVYILPEKKFTISYLFCFFYRFNMVKSSQVSTGISLNFPWCAQTPGWESRFTHSKPRTHG